MCAENYYICHFNSQIIRGKLNFSKLNYKRLLSSLLAQSRSNYNQSKHNFTTTCYLVEIDFKIYEIRILDIAVDGI